jgi:hypothetical protein
MVPATQLRMHVVTHRLRPGGQKTRLPGRDSAGSATDGLPLGSAEGKEAQLGCVGHQAPLVVAVGTEVP